MGVETTAKKVITFRDDDYEKGRQIFSSKNRVTTISCRPGWHQP